MGKGDKKTKRGKIIQGSSGAIRKKKLKKTGKISPKKEELELENKVEVKETKKKSEETKIVKDETPKVEKQ